jgi:hypothetical protein
MADMPLYDHGGRDAKVLHRGWAMLGAITAGDGRFSGLHITWIDLDQTGGKAKVIEPETGELLPAKKVRGSKAGGVIDLASVPLPRQLVMGEGIETTLSVWIALRKLGRDLSGTSFACAIDLGNLGGRAVKTLPHPTLKTAANRPQRVPGPVPDLDAPGIAIADSVTDIVLLGDGDSDRFLTECALARAARRFARSCRSVRVAWAPAGHDFNDIVRSAG